MAQQVCSGLHKGNRSGSAGWNVDDFLALVSHELRNSTHAIITWADYLRRSPVTDKTLSEATEAIMRNGKLQANLVEQLLNLSRINSVRIHFDFRSLALEQVLDASVKTMIPQAALRSVDLHAKLESLPAAVFGDSARLQEVFTNLLSNAIKFTPPGGRVELRCRARLGYAQVSVTDTGLGISAQFLPHVFERYRREKRNATEAPGLGLGLAITRYIVEQHHGRIYAMSPGEGKGATFRVYFPLVAHTAQTDIKSTRA